jgi:hypothetical protein
MTATFKDIFAHQIFGITVSEAHNQGICVCHKRPFEKGVHTELDEREYEISGLCPTGFDEITGKDKT